jgi:hypothetical protein
MRLIVSEVRRIVLFLRRDPFFIWFDEKPVQKFSGLAIGIPSNRLGGASFSAAF